MLKMNGKAEIFEDEYFVTKRLSKQHIRDYRSIEMFWDFVC